MVHHKGSNGTFAVLSLADLLQTASPPSRRAGGGLPGLAPVQAPHVHRRQPRHAPRDGPLPGPRHAPPPKPEGLTAVIPTAQEGAEGTARPARPPFHLGHSPIPLGPRSIWGTAPYNKRPPPLSRRGPPLAKCPLVAGGVLLSHGLLRSTIGARGLNFRVRDGSGCASPAMAAGRQGAFCCCRAGRVAVPSGPHSVTAREGSSGRSRRKSSAD